VTKQAYNMVSIYGLNDKIGNISFYDSSGQSDYSFQKPYSEKTAETIDAEAKLIIDNAYIRTKKILSENREKLNELAELLLEKEVIFKEDMERIFGARPFIKDEAPLIHNEDEKKVQEKIDAEVKENDGEDKAPSELIAEVKDEKVDKLDDNDTKDGPTS